MMDQSQKRPREMFEEHLVRRSIDYLTPQTQVPVIIQQSLTFDSIDGQNFPFKLWFIINNQQFGDVLHWSQDGTAIVFPDERLFLQKILKRKEGKIFKTESLKSFVRQLNLYGFRKVMSDRYDGIGRTKFGSMFDHEYFLRGRPDLLEYVKRRCNVKLQKEPDTTPGLGLNSALQDRNRAYGLQSTIDYGERAPKRRLFVSPVGKENQFVECPLDDEQRIHTPLSPPSGHIGYHSLYQNYPITSQMLQNTESGTLTALEEAATLKRSIPGMATSIPNSSVVTIPRSAMLPTPSNSRLKDTELKFDGGRISLADSLAYILSPNTPSEISQVTAAYLTTPSTLADQGANFVSPNAVNIYSATGPSPLSALCATLFSPLHDNKGGIHKATQTSGEPKSLSLLADEAKRMNTSFQALEAIIKDDDGSDCIEMSASAGDEATPLGHFQAQDGVKTMNTSFQGLEPIIKDDGSDCIELNTSMEDEATQVGGVQPHDRTPELQTAALMRHSMFIGEHEVSNKVAEHVGNLPAPFQAINKDSVVAKEGESSGNVANVLEERAPIVQTAVMFSPKGHVDNKGTVNVAGVAVSSQDGEQFLAMKEEAPCSIASEVGINKDVMSAEQNTAPSESVDEQSTIVSGV